MRKKFLKTPIDDYSSYTILQKFRNEIGSKKTRIIVTPNLDHIVRNYRDKNLSRIYNKAWLSINDSAVIPLFARFNGIQIQNINPGSDITETIFSSGLLSSHTINIIGGDTKDVDQVMDAYGISKYNHHNPPMGFINDVNATKKCTDFVVSQSADITFLCVGSPQQEKLAELIANNSDKCGLLLCVGASLEFLSGKQKRAPKIYRKLRLEWFYRLLENPKRMATRYLVRCPKVIGYLLIESLTKKNQKR